MTDYFICKRCGEVVSADEIGSHEELMGECWGTPAYELVMDGCHCGGEYVPAKQCEHCGEYFPESCLELGDGLCLKCDNLLSSIQEQVEMAFRNGEDIKLLQEKQK